MSTPEIHVQEMRALCQELLKSDIVGEAIVDDWGAYSNFQLVVRPASPDRYFTVRLKKLLISKLPANTFIRQIISPAQSGNSYWMVDIDYYTYVPETNAFSWLTAA